MQLEQGFRLVVPSNTLRQEVAEGLLYSHGRLNVNTGKTLEAEFPLYAAVELVNGKLYV